MGADTRWRCDKIELRGALVYPRRYKKLPSGSFLFFSGQSVDFSNDGIYSGAKQKTGLLSYFLLEFIYGIDNFVYCCAKLVNLTTSHRRRDVGNEMVIHGFIIAKLGYNKKV